jgi:hypothetical protein
LRNAFTILREQGITRGRRRYRIVGMENWAPSLMPDGQRAVTVFVLV